MNIKEIEFTEKADTFTNYTYKPQLKTLGPKYGKLLPKIKQHLEAVDGAIVRSAIDKDQNYEFDIDSMLVSLSVDDLIEGVTQKEGYASEITPRLAAVIDTTLTPELIEEGYVREIVSKIQTMRKDAGFEVQDKIIFSTTNNDIIGMIVSDNQDTIKDETLANDIIYSEIEGYTKEWKINDQTVTFFVKKV